jgi:hypothetical protein
MIGNSLIALEAADAARKELEGEGKFYVTFCLL